MNCIEKDIKDKNIRLHKAIIAAFQLDIELFPVDKADTDMTLDMIAFAACEHYFALGELAALRKQLS